MEQMTLTQFLQWLVFGGGSSVATSWLLERWAWFQAQSSNAKQFISFVATAGLSVGAYALILFAPGFIALASPYFAILAVIFAGVFLGKTFHKVDKKELKG